MKTMLLLLSFLLPCTLLTQTVLQSGVYHWKGGQAQMISDSTRDLSSFRVHTSTLQPGKTNHPSRAYDDVEEILIVKEGTLTVLINDSSKSLGPGGLAMIVAGDRQSFRNDGQAPAVYYVLTFKSKNPVSIERGRQGGGTFIKDWKDFVVKKTDKGESRPVFDQPSSMFERFDVHATSLNPGMLPHDPHRHRAEEFFVLLKGDVQVQCGDSFYDAHPGDVVFQASEGLHGIKNTGKVQCAYMVVQWHNKKED